MSSIKIWEAVKHLQYFEFEKVKTAINTLLSHLSLLN